VLDRCGKINSMIATAADYAWFASEPGGFAEAYCLTLVRGLVPAEFLARIDARPGLRYVGVAAMFGPSMALWNSEQAGQDLLIGVTTVPGNDGGWTLGVEINGFLGVTEPLLRSLSARTTAVSAYRNFNAGNRFYWVEDRDIRLDFSPMDPYYRDGSTPDAAVGLMRQAGFILDKDGMVERSDEAALALAELLTGVRLTQQTLQGATFQSAIASVPPG
jgi:hypothetical protein